MARRGSNSRTKVRKDAKAAGFRSGFEHMIATLLDQAGVEYEYESVKIKYETKPSVYTPDFILPNGVIIEAKGRFTASDRTKHELIKAQHPELDIRFVFQYNNPIRKGSKTRYSDWCDKRGFLYAFNEIPEEWHE